MCQQLINICPCRACDCGGSNTIAYCPRVHDNDGGCELKPRIALLVGRGTLCLGCRFGRHNRRQAWGIVPASMWHLHCKKHPLWHKLKPGEVRLPPVKVPRGGFGAEAWNRIPDEVAAPFTRTDARLLSALEAAYRKAPAPRVLMKAAAAAAAANLPDSGTGLVAASSVVTTQPAYTGGLIELEANEPVVVSKKAAGSADKADVPSNLPDSKGLRKIPSGYTLEEITFPDRGYPYSNPAKKNAFSASVETVEDEEFGRPIDFSDLNNSLFEHRLRRDSVPEDSAPAKINPFGSIGQPVRSS